MWIEGSADKVGAKAAALQRLACGGLPVPNAVVLGADLAEQCVPRAEVDALFEAVLSGREWRRHAVSVRAALASGVLPPSVLDALHVAAERLQFPLAVRSSGLAEGSIHASFAGLFSTFLGVDGSELISAVRAVWASRFSDTVIRYAVGRGVDPRDTGMGVIVQEAVDARSAGSGLSCDPTGTITLTGAWGLGRAVAEAQVVPDFWRIDRHGSTILEHRVGSKQIVARLRPGGGEEWRRQSPSRAVAPCLDSKLVSRLARLVVEVEQVFGSPQEVEWAVDRRRRLWLLQARPIRHLALDEGHMDALQGTIVDGLPASPGRVTGRARVFRCFDDLRPGEVVIARTLPPGVTALLPGTSALVLESGGTTAHAASIARERGIPAVFGAARATQLIPDDTLVTVDGTTGRVWVHAR